MIEEVFDITTCDGMMNTYVYRPEEGAAHPLIVFLMDSAGVRESLADLCRRLASAGYCVAMPNLYYRAVRHLDISVDRLGDPAYGEQTSLMWRLNRSTRVSTVMSDVEALLQYFRAVDWVCLDRVGTIGYCLSGRYSFAAATHFPEQVRASACIYGVDYINGEEDSAHLGVSRLRAEIYVAMAQHDPYVPQGTYEQLKSVFESAKINHRIEIYPGVEHGFALPGRRVYHKPSAERHWERIHSLFRRNLQVA